MDTWLMEVYELCPQRGAFQKTLISTFFTFTMSTIHVYALIGMVNKSTYSAKDPQSTVTPLTPSHIALSVPKRNTNVRGVEEEKEEKEKDKKSV